MEDTYTMEEPKVTEPRPYIEHELLAEIFQLIPSDVLADMYNLANALFYNVMKGAADKLATECPEKRREIGTALNAYQIIAETKLDEVFNVFQQYVTQSTWKIPDELDVQFDQHQEVDFNITAQDQQDLDKQLDDLRRKIVTQKQFKAILTDSLEKKRLKVDGLDSLSKNLEFLDSIPQEENVEDVNNTLIFVREQIDKLKDAIINIASEDVSAIPENQRSLYLRSRLNTQLKQLLKHSS